MGGKYKARLIRQEETDTHWASGCPKLDRGGIDNDFMYEVPGRRLKELKDHEVYFKMLQQEA